MTTAAVTPFEMNVASWVAKSAFAKDQKRFSLAPLIAAKSQEQKGVRNTMDIIDDALSILDDDF